MHPNGTGYGYAPGEVASALAAARELIAAGVPVFVAPPCPPDCPREGHGGSRGTMGSGFDLPRRWQTAPLDPGAPDRWTPGAALCAVMGHTLDLVDVDPRNGGDARALVALDLLPDHVADAETPSGGTHYFVAALGVGSLDGKIAPGVDLKGGCPDGSGRGFAFIAPTVRASKADGVARAYRWTSGPDAEFIAAETAGTRSGEELAERVRSLRPERVPRAPQAQPGAQLDADADDGLGDAVIPWAQAARNLNEAYAAFYDMDPATGSGFNAALNRTAFILGKYIGSVTDYREASELLYEAAEHNGCVRRVGPHDYRPMGAGAVRATIASGLAAGMRRPNTVGPREPRDDPEGSPGGDDQPGHGRDAVGTWSRQDLDAYLDGSHVPETATRFARDDGVMLLYPGRVHSFHGESESGKSLVAQYVCAEALLAGDEALYVDFESDAANLVERLLAYGVPVDTLRKSFTYVRPDGPPTGEGEREAYAELFAHPYVVAVIDGVTESMGMFGVESSGDNDQVAKWMRRFPRRLAGRTGAAVVLIDHVTKSPESRGRFALGAQAKLAGLDGAAYTVEVREGLGRGARGAVSMRIAKDRPGDIRPKCGPFRASDRTQEAAYLVIDSTGTDGRIRVEVRPPRADADAAGPLMEQVSRYLETVAEPPGQNVLCAAVTGRAIEIRHAANRLIALGFVKLVDGPRNVRMHVSVKPYRTRSGSGDALGDEDDNDDFD